jgi:hypothetical protein
VIDLDGVVDHEIDRHARLHASEVRSPGSDGGAHGREVDQERHAGEVLKQDTPDDERHLRRPRSVGPLSGEGLDVFVPDSQAIDVTEHRLEKDADRDGETGDPPDPGLLEQR